MGRGDGGGRLRGEEHGAGEMLCHAFRNEKQEDRRWGGKGTSPGEEMQMVNSPRHPC